MVTIGGKGSSLSSASVYAIANGLCQVKIDSSVLDRLSKEHNVVSIPADEASSPRFLTLEEARAALVVLLKKLLLLSDKIRPELPELIVETLNRGFLADNMDFGSASRCLYSLSRLNDKKIDEMGVTQAVWDCLENSCYVLDGICAVLDYSSSVLSTVADVVAAFSCEALKADISGLNLIDSGDGFCVKDEIAVASDLKVLLTGSKLVGGVVVDAINEIPKVNGTFREVARLVHLRMRVELNGGKAGSSIGGVGKVLVTTLSPLATSLLFLCESSLGRVELTVESLIKSISDDGSRTRLREMFDKGCPSFDGLKKGFWSISQAALVEDYVSFLQEINSLLLTVREIVAWEAALTFLLLEEGESGHRTQGVASSRPEVNGESVNVDKKVEKKKKKSDLGKGTAVVRQLIKERLLTDTGDRLDKPALLEKWVRDLSSFLEPKHPELDTLLKKVKEMVESNETRRLPKLPKGTRDFSKEQMAIRERAFSIIVEVFKRHGAMALDTPAFELRETLMGKYGEDSKLIYDLADQGGELCSLRYDLTVPFARYVAMNGITSFKRYQIAKVYRRDNPSKGRYREFYQCDFDIAGQYERMGPDWEVIKIFTELLDELEIGDYEIKLNHRKLLDGMLEICGVPPEKFRTICSSIDKLDKQSFEQIKKEMVEEKGLTLETADRIGTCVKKRGPPLELLSELKEDGSQFLKNNESLLALNDLEILFKALERSKCMAKVVFDLSLARGLDYYTGVIFEAVFKGSTQVGSIGAGGRYDNLIGMFGTKQVPAVGVSLGIERVFTIMEQLQKDRNQATRATETQVLVGILGDDLSIAAELISELWNSKIKAEYMVNKRVMKQIDRAKESRIPWMVIVGEREQSEGIVKLKDIEANKEEIVPRTRLVEELQRRLNGVSL